jgi:hypothetical protein
MYVTPIALMLFTSISAGADDPGASIFSLGGFGTVGVVHSNESLADFTASFLQPTGAGYTHSWSASVDSLLGAQLTANFTPQLSALVQVVTQQNYNNTYWPHVEWADIKYQVTPEFSVRVGRIVRPSFLVSDSREVGYGNLWVRPPLEVYGLIPINNSDGVDASYGLRMGSVIQTLVATYGNSSPQIPTFGGAYSRRNWLIADTIEYGPTTFHAAYQQGRISIVALSALLDAFEQFGPQGDSIEAAYDPDDRLFTFISFGAMYDPGRWYAAAEWATVDFHSVLGRKTGWYVSTGYRLTKFTPYATFAQATADNLFDPGLTVTALPLFLQVPAGSLNAALNKVLSSKPVQKTISFGVRWDFIKNTDLKVQFDRTFIGAGSSGTLTDLQPGFPLGSDFSVFSATVDFVF